MRKAPVSGTPRKAPVSGTLRKACVTGTLNTTCVLRALRKACITGTKSTTCALGTILSSSRPLLAQRTRFTASVPRTLLSTPCTVLKAQFTSRVFHQKASSSACLPELRLLAFAQQTSTRCSSLELFQETLGTTFSQWHQETLCLAGAPGIPSTVSVSSSTRMMSSLTSSRWRPLCVKKRRRLPFHS